MMAEIRGREAISWTVECCQEEGVLGVEGGVVTIKLELLNRVRDGRGGIRCELSWAAKRWQRLWGGDGFIQVNDN